MIKSKEVVDYLLALESVHGRSIVRQGCREYMLQRTYATEQKGKRTKISAGTRRKIYEVQSGMCANLACRKPCRSRDMEVDEFIPVAHGGSTTRTNTRLLCKDCNRSKSSHTPSEEAKRTGIGVLEQVQNQMKIAEALK